ncbi:hypothetical protein HNP38_002817 [Chryseobacterium defluvii]|uniref:Secretion system C-terminal sorting domain-containing protein n=1 Tax=Chryseobacterium defluvii TaxID=160396 RepID=A0A840KDN6_9FLAO|nr:LamG-like jellyroll fold domain-containing protein [Chryseobacterium defluvii]MBB4807511.1 hypothetical protein [Chryseobacterium defluvii]
MRTTITCLLFLIFQFVNAQVTNGLIQSFRFNNNYTNDAGDVTFSTTSLTADRDGVPNSAINITYSSQSQAVIPGLPYGSSPRTIAFWAKANSFSGLNYDPVFTYGTGTPGNSCGGSFSADRVMFLGHTDNLTLILGNQNVAGAWYHFIMTYDGTAAKIYRNGSLLGQLDKSWNTINNNDIFRLGVGVGGEQWFSGAVDELKIYNRALDSSEAVELYKGEIRLCDNVAGYFGFNASASSHNGSSVFTTTDPVYPVMYTPDRNNMGNGALQTFQAATQPRAASIPGLPVGNSARTIAFWMKTSTAFTSQPTYFTYGNNANNQTFGLYSATNGNLVFQGFGAGNDVVITNSQLALNNWYHIAVVYNSYTVKVYVNGVLRHSFSNAALNTGNSAFRIGSFNGAVDDLLIYSRALSFGEIESLYSNGIVSCGTLAVSESNMTVKGNISLYPVPVKDFLTIKTEEPVEKVEIFSFSGRKIMEERSLRIDMGQLPAGNYIIRITGRKNNVYSKVITRSDK